MCHLPAGGERRITALLHCCSRDENAICRGWFSRYKIGRHLGGFRAPAHQSAISSSLVVGRSWRGEGLVLARSLAVRKDSKVRRTDLEETEVPLSYFWLRTNDKVRRTDLVNFEVVLTHLLGED